MAKRSERSSGLARRLLKKAHLRRWRARALAAAYPEYASLGPSRAALHLDLFEQPAEERAFWQLAKGPRESGHVGTPSRRRAGYTKISATKARKSTKWMAPWRAFVCPMR